MNIDELLAEARDALGRVNTNAFEHDLLFQYRGGVLGREITLIVRDLADGIEALLDRVEKAEQEAFDFVKQKAKEGAREKRELESRVRKAEQALQRVRDRHQPCLSCLEPHCFVCEKAKWPCAEFRALEGDE